MSIVNAIHKMIVAFEEIGLNPPTSIKVTRDDYDKIKSFCGHESHQYVSLSYQNPNEIPVLSILRIKIEEEVKNHDNR